MKKITDRDRLDWLEEYPLAGLVIYGRLGIPNVEPIIGCKTGREAIDAAILSERGRGKGS